MLPTNARAGEAACERSEPVIDMDTARSDLAHVLERFPEAANPIRRLFLADRGFRSVCEDYALARDALARFQAMPNAQQRPEVADYQTVIADLESGNRRHHSQCRWSDRDNGSMTAGRPRATG